MSRPSLLTKQFYKLPSREGQDHGSSKRHLAWGELLFAILSE